MRRDRLALDEPLTGMAAMDGTNYAQLRPHGIRDIMHRRLQRWRGIPSNGGFQPFHLSKQHALDDYLIKVRPHWHNVCYLFRGFVLALIAQSMDAALPDGLHCKQKAHVRL